MNFSDVPVNSLVVGSDKDGIPWRLWKIDNETYVDIEVCNVVFDEDSLRNIAIEKVLDTPQKIKSYLNSDEREETVYEM